MKTSKSEQKIAEINARTTITALRNRRKKAIAVLDFEKAEQISEEIENEHHQALEETVARIREEFRNEIASLIERNFDQLEEKSQEKNRQEKIIRTRYHTIFKDLQKQHLLSLGQMENKYTENIAKENDRRVPEQFALLEQAKKAATAGQFREAIDLRNQARIVAQQDLEKRIHMLDEEFELNRERMLNSQREDLLKLTSRLQNELDTLEETANEKYIQINKTRDTWLVSIYQKASLKVANAASKSPVSYQKELEDDFTEICDQYGCEKPKLPPVSSKTMTKSRLQVRQ